MEKADDTFETVLRATPCRNTILSVIAAAAGITALNAATTPTLIATLANENPQTADLISVEIAGQSDPYFVRATKIVPPGAVVPATIHDVPFTQNLFSSGDHLVNCNVNFIHYPAGKA